MPPKVMVQPGLAPPEHLGKILFTSVISKGTHLVPLLLISCIFSLFVLCLYILLYENCK